MAQEYKLKGITSLDLKQGDKQEVEVEGVENGKVLLVNSQGKVHAMSSKCTHYGAPLKLGVVTGDNRITCAWHGACFNIETGDVEDAPALDPLAKFKITEKDGAVYITGDESTIKSSRRSPNHTCSAQGNEGVVIIGGGSATAGALEGLRGNGYKGAITVLSKEPQPFDRTKLSKALIGDISKLALRTPEYYKDASIDLVNDTVTGVDFSGKKVKTESGKTYPYTKLILATGGTPKMLPMPGFKDLENVFLLRSLPHVQNILSAVGEAKGKKVVVVGSSFIGMEVGNCLANMGQDVSIIGMESMPLEAIMGKEVGEIFKKTLEKNGVTFYMESGVEKATPSKSDSKKVGGVELKGGKTLEADIVILGVGVSPQTGYLSEAKEIELLKDGSLKTDESFAVAGLKDVFAVGDIATYPYHGPDGNGKPVRIEHWNVAQNAGRSVGTTIAHPSSKPKSFIPVFWSALGSQMRYCGHTPNGWDDLVMKGEPENGKFAAYYAKGETVVAVASMMMDPIMSQSAELMRRGKMPTKSDLKKGANILEIGIPAQIKI
ncbi:MAG: hypothetical protein M1827_006364 [Pycnora praestabilis]|nr:MAG: hypothetical protein M1827_006364 [Pycnora praestabilis]